MEFFSKQNELEKYAEIGKISYQLFHDILNPITGFVLYLEALNQKAFQTKEIDYQIDNIIESSQKIRNFIKLVQEDLFSPNKKQTIEVTKTIREIMSLIYYKAKNQNVSIILISNSRIYLRINKMKFYQIIINILSNSIDSYEKINDSRKRNIIINVKEENGYIKFNFIDNGCGIEKKNLSKIFDERYSTKENNFGIGLKTTKKIILEDCSGEIKVSSKPQRGTTFNIKLTKNHSKF